jgi:hypothetical protein
MKTKIIFRAVPLGLMLMMFLLHVACGSARRSEPLNGPLILPSAEVKAGEVVFMQNCNKCHPGGEGGLGPAINNKPVPTFVKRFQVRHGLGVMPGFSDQEISDQELDNLMAYLKALSRHENNTELTASTNGKTSTNGKN